MINQTKKEMAAEAAREINHALTARIPYYRELVADDSPHYVYQSDIFGCVDTVTLLGSETVYRNQSKSRSGDKTPDICIECRSFRGQPQNLKTGENAPIAGAYWCSGWQRWLSPRFGQCDTLTYYLPQVPIVLHFSRYYLEIMLSKPDTWAKATGIHRKNDDTDTFIAFWYYRDFTQIYMDTVAQTAYGEGETGVQISLEAGETGQL